MAKYKCNTISEFHHLTKVPAPQNPLFSIHYTKQEEGDETACKPYDFDEPIELTCNFYSIAFKNIISGELVYGRTKYDCSNGVLLLTAPNQKITFENLVFSSESYHVVIHEDYIRNLDIYKEMKKYSFFNYNVNEALHLSPREENIVKGILKSLHAEYYNNPDEFSKRIIISQLEILLSYVDRFYKRQFLDREEENKILITKFKTILMSYFEQGLFAEKGIPSVEWMASQLNVSHRYMSDTIKAETGKTAIEQIHLFIIEEAKGLLLNPNYSISETAYKLGFEYPNYFSKLFKKKVGMTPKEYIGSYSMS